MRRRALTVVAVVVALALSGCTPLVTSSATPTPTPTRTPTPTATPTPAPSTASAVPVLAFGGDCASVFADPRAVLGFDPTLRQIETPTGLGTLGGLRCEWTAVDDIWEGLAFTALPVLQVPHELRSRYETTACDWSYDTLYCHLAASAGGTWVMVSKEALDDSGTPPDLAPVLTAALESASVAPEPVAASPTTEWWEPVDCAALESAAGIAEVFAPHTFESSWPGGAYSWPTDALLAPTDQWCPWYSYDAGVGVWLNVLPGAGSVWDGSDFEGGTPVDVAGAQDAVIMPSAGGDVLYATDGANVLRIRESPIPMPDLAARIFAAMP